MMIMYSQHAQVFHLVKTQLRLWQAGAESISVTWETKAFLASAYRLALRILLCSIPLFVSVPVKFDIT